MHMWPDMYRYQKISKCAEGYLHSCMHMIHVYASVCVISGIFQHIHIYLRVCLCTCMYECSNSNFYSYTHIYVSQIHFKILFLQLHLLERLYIYVLEQVKNSYSVTFLCSIINAKQNYFQCFCELLCKFYPDVEF